VCLASPEANLALLVAILLLIRLRLLCHTRSSDPATLAKQDTLASSVTNKKALQ